MPLPDKTLLALKKRGLIPQQDVLMAKRTWWRAGGPADGLLRATSVHQLQAALSICKETDVNVIVLGNASNLLIADRGIRGLVVKLTGDLAASSASDGILTVGAGVKLMSLVRQMKKRGWTGLEFFAGIPGTVGGAILMNAGTRLGETCDRLIDVQLTTSSGTKTNTREQLNPQYRSIDLPSGAIISSARFRLGGPTPEQSTSLINEHLEYRANTQPTDLPTCGSTFRNPPGDSAGRLIDAAGLKGFRIGDAMVTHKHANFIANIGAATATDIRQVIEHVQRTVFETFQVQLKREVHFVGDWG